MTIQDLGSIGEMVGAIAIVATLAYLAVQIRQNTRTTRATNFHNLIENNSAFTSMIGENEDLVAFASGGMKPKRGTKLRSERSWIRYWIAPPLNRTIQPTEPDHRSQKP